MMPRLLALLLCLAAAALPAPAAAAPDQADFTRQMAERFRAALPDREIEITEPLQLRIAGDPDHMLVNVGRIFNFCENASAEECEASAAHLVAESVESFLSLDAPIAREQLRVAVRHTDFCDHADQSTRSASEPPVLLIRPVAPQLCATVMADYPNRMRAIRNDELEGLGLDADSAWALAERQTFADLPQPDRLEGLATGLVAVTEFDYVPSLLLDVEGWRRAAAAVDGDLIVAVPSDGLLVAGPRAVITDMPGFQATTGDNFDTAERGISPLVYRWVNGTWVPLD